MTHSRKDGRLKFPISSHHKRNRRYGFNSRGRRTSVLEQFDTDGQAGFELVQEFAWSYDDLDRLTAETFDLDDDGSSAGDYVTMYSFDLNDNRFSKQTQHDYSGPVGQMLADETVSYAYDGNGRLLQETLDAAGTADDRTTAYHYGTSYDRTEQTGKTVHDGLTTAGTVLEDVTQAHDLAGRQVSVTVDKTPSGGDVAITTFTYDNAGHRVTQTADQGAEAVTTTYLIDDNNFTGYSQTLEQTDRDSSDTVIKTTTYTIGADVHSQYVTTTAGTQGSIFLTDGRGSTRALYESSSAALRDAAQVSAGGAWTKTLRYDAYGNALGFAAATTVTEMLYNGESFNARTGQQYLRARWYDPSAGRFGRIDPYAGSIYSPHTLNAYAYCGGDPVNYADPSGLVFSMQLLGEIMEFGAEGVIELGVGTLGLAKALGSSFGSDRLFRLGVQLLGAGALYWVIAQAVQHGGGTRPGDLPARGEPGSTDVVDRGGGDGTIRDYGADGRASTDYDFGHDHGAGDPHAHDWDWSQPRPRQPGRSLRPGE